MENRRSILGLAALAAFSILSLSAWAVTPRFWEDFTQEELLSGTLDRVSLAPDGTLSLAPAYDTLFDTGQPYIFSMIQDRQGNLYAGTGGEGKIFKIDPQGKGGLYLQTKEPTVFALALDGADVLYAGTSPDGKIYKIANEGQAEEFCDLQTRYIWALTFDEAGNLYAGTGNEGVIYRIDRSGSKSVFYSSGDTHVRSLAWREKNLVAGTSPGGKVVEIAPDGKGFTLADTPLEEINALAVGRDGTVYAAASSIGAASVSSSLSATKPAARASLVTVVEVVASSPTPPTPSRPTASSTAALPSSSGVTAKSSIYAIGRNGDIEVILDSTQAAYDIVARADGSLLLATGPKGRLLELDATGQVSFLTDSPEEDAVRLISANDAVYVATSNLGKLYRFSLDSTREGKYESSVLDAGTVASWGRISWRGSDDTAVAIATRAGNTAEPDGSWSAWSESYKSGDAITNPRARYLQWRAVFKTSRTSPKPVRLNQVRIAYLQQNLRPKVTEIAQLPAGVELQAQPSLAGSMGIVSVASGGRSLLAPRERGRDTMPMDPKQVVTPGAQSFTWKASDENEDALDYAVYFKELAGEAEADWKPLAKNLKDAFYTLNTAALPDGAYRLKVTASDEPSNPPETALVGENISEPFVIAVATPRVEIVSSAMEGKKAVVRFRAGVASGSIASAEYSVDGARWLLLFPEDGIADSAMEEYRFTTPELAPGEHLIGIRASDRGGTTGTASVLARVPR